MHFSDTCNFCDVGPEPLLVAEQAVVLTDDRDEALAIARAHTAPYVGSPPHERKFAALGFVPEDWTDQYSDRLLEALVAWGSVDDCIARLQAHRDAGADHVGCYLLGTETVEQDLSGYTTLAEALGVGQ